MSNQVERVRTVTIRFAGDSGDGMQLTGTRFTSATAAMGNDLATLPDFPAEIRAPAGSLPGVSGFQLHFADHDILTPGDAPDVLVSMNPAALKVNLGDLEPGATVILNEDAFTPQNLKKARYEADPREDGTLEPFQVVEVPITTMTVGALEKYEDLGKKEKQRAKNMFALGLMSCMYSRPTEPTTEWLADKFSAQPSVAAANIAAFDAGWAFGETTELFGHQYEVAPADLPPGRYRQITGNQAISCGLVAAADRSGLRLFLGGYPITPASDVLHELARYKQFGVQTFQAEDEIAGVGASLGASFAGNLAATVTSGPGIALKTEFIGLAVMAEIPLVIVNVQRGGPATGLPTKVEQGDLLACMVGQPGDAPKVVMAASGIGECFHFVITARKIAESLRMPVILLTGANLATGQSDFARPEFEEGWLAPPVDQSPWEPGVPPYSWDEETGLSRRSIPGQPGGMHVVTGLAHDENSRVAYASAINQRGMRMRSRKLAAFAKTLKPPKVYGDEEGDLLVVGWGATRGSIEEAVDRLRADGEKVGTVHLRFLSPLEPGLKEIFDRFKKVMTVEINYSDEMEDPNIDSETRRYAQLAYILRAQTLVDVDCWSRVPGKPLPPGLIEEALRGKLAALKKGES